MGLKIAIKAAALLLLISGSLNLTACTPVEEEMVPAEQEDSEPAPQLRCGDTDRAPEVSTKPCSVIPAEKPVRVPQQLRD